MIRHMWETKMVFMRLLNFVKLMDEDVYLSERT